MSFLSLLLNSFSDANAANEGRVDEIITSIERRRRNDERQKELLRIEIEVARDRQRKQNEALATNYALKAKDLKVRRRAITEMIDSISIEQRNIYNKEISINQMIRDVENRQKGPRGLLVSIKSPFSRSTAREASQTEGYRLDLIKKRNEVSSLADYYSSEIQKLQTEEDQLKSKRRKMKRKGRNLLSSEY